MITTGRTVVTCRPATIEDKRTHRTQRLRKTGSRRLSKVDKFRALYKSIDSRLRELQMATKTGYSVAKDGQKLSLHFLLALYVADLPETEDLLALKQASQIFTRLHVYLTRREKVQYCSRIERRI